MQRRVDAGAGGVHRELTYAVVVLLLAVAVAAGFCCIGVGGW